MPSSCRKPIEAAIARSLKTIPIAVKSIDARTYHPSVRSLSVILDEGREDLAVLTLPGFLIGESGPAFAGGSSFFRIESFEDAIAAYAEPIGR